MTSQHAPQQSNNSPPLSRSGSKRSTSNLAHLRLAPLSTKYAEQSRDHIAPRSPYDASPEFTRGHSSYFQGKSAPTTPGILSRSSSRKNLAGAWKRRGSLHDDEGRTSVDVAYEYSGDAEAKGPRATVGSGRIPKAKSEATLLVQPQRHPPGQQAGIVLRPRKKDRSRPSRMSGADTPHVMSMSKLFDADWLTRTGVATNAMLQESKGQSYLASTASSTSLAGLDAADDDDEGYEEMAALSAVAIKFQSAEANVYSPTTPRASQWGSRYGSRPVSRRTSRRGSMTGSRTPLASIANQDALANYFETQAPISSHGFDGADEDSEDTSADESEVARLTADRAYGFGGLMNRIVNFNLFQVDESTESATEDEVQPLEETEAEAKQRMAAENKRKREEKERLVALPAPPDGSEGASKRDVGWKDAAWLLSVASKVMFSDASE